MTFKHSMDDKTGFEATDEEMGLKTASHITDPWVAHRQAMAVSSGQYDWSLQDDDMAFLMFDFHPEIKDDEQHDIACLIAAAPDMLCALKESVLQLQYLADKFGETGTGAAVLARVQAAIAKAESRS